MTRFANRNSAAQDVQFADATYKSGVDGWINVLSGLLVTAAVGPLLALGFFIVVDRLFPDAAGRILGLMMRLFTFQWLIAGLINVGGGLALAILGIWGALRFGTVLHVFIGLLTIAFGMWRALRGIGILRGFRNEN